MANEENRSVNEVVLNGTTIISTREDSVAEDNLVMDETATNKAGEKIKGELDVASADETYNINDPVDDIADEDYIPFNDVSDSEMPKKKTLFSSFIEKLTKYFLPASSIGGKSQLKFNDSGVLDLQLNDIDASKTNNNVTSIHYPTTSNVLDKARRIIMRTEAVVNPDGNIGWKAYVRNYNTSGENVGQKGIQFHMNKSGNLSYQVDDARAFREAIGTMDVIGTSLPSGTVIDDYHTSAYTGVYYFADDGVAGNITTLPEAICGKLIVANNGNGGFSQYYIPNHSVKLWVRVWWSNAWSAWENIAREHTYDKGDEIPANANLNTYTTAGVYQCELTATARTMSNLPYTGNDRLAFKLIVMKDRKNANLVQWYIPYESNPTWAGSKLAYRTTDDGGTNWSEWAIIARINDIIPPTIGGGYAVATVSGTAITATISGYKLVAGGIVSLKIPSQLASACTLNINSTGAKNVKNWNDQDPTYGHPIHATLTTFIYDGTYYRVIAIDKVPYVFTQEYVADTSGNDVIEWGYGANRAQLKYGIATNKLAWNYYKNSAWRGDVKVADYDDIVHQTLGVTIPDNADLNNYTTNGIYNISTNAKAATISHMPSANAGKLIVMRNAGNRYVNQYFLPFFGFDGAYGHKISRRAYDADASTPYWTDWTTITEQTAPISGNIKILLKTETTTAQNRFVGLTAAIKDTTTGKTFSYDVLKAYQDHQAEPVGLDLVVEGGGNTFIGGGDGGTALYPLKKGDAGENLYLLADGYIYLEANSQTIANRQGFRVDTNGTIIPVKAEALTDNFGAIGESSHKLANLWVYKINGSDPVTSDTYSAITASELKAGTSTTLRTVRADYLRSGIRDVIGDTSLFQKIGAIISKQIEIPDNSGYRKILKMVDITTWYNSTTTGQNAQLFNGWIISTREGGYFSNAEDIVRIDMGVTYEKVTSLSVNNSKALRLFSDNPRYAPCILQETLNGTTKYYLAIRFENAGRIATLFGRIRMNDNWGSNFINQWVNYDSSGNLPSGYTVVMWGATTQEDSAYATCTTAADQQIKVATINDPSWTLKVGRIVGVKFSNTNTYNATSDNKVQLNVNQTGAKPIYYNTGYPTGTNTTAFGIANRVHYYMYDGSNWCWLNAGYESDTTDPRSLGFGYGTCDTAEATTAKVVTLSSYTLRTGGYVTVWFKEKVPANATMNINSKGAKPIYYRGSAIGINQIKAGDRATFIFDGTNYQLVGVDRDNYLKINYRYIDTTGTPSSSYITNLVSELKITEMTYVVEGDMVDLGFCFVWSASKTYSSTTALFKLNYAGRQVIYWTSNNGTAYGYLNSDGNFYIRPLTVNGTYYVQMSFIKAGA